MSRPQTEQQWLLVLDVIERLYAEVRASNWDGVRDMLNGYAKPAPETDTERSARRDVETGREMAGSENGQQNSEVRSVRYVV